MPNSTGTAAKKPRSSVGLGAAPVDRARDFRRSWLRLEISRGLHQKCDRLTRPLLCACDWTLCSTMDGPTNQPDRSGSTLARMIFWLEHDGEDVTNRLSRRRWHARCPLPPGNNARAPFAIAFPPGSVRIQMNRFQRALDPCRRHAREIRAIPFLP